MMDDESVDYSTGIPEEKRGLLWSLMDTPGPSNQSPPNLCQEHPPVPSQHSEQLGHLSDFSLSLWTREHSVTFFLLIVLLSYKQVQRPTGSLVRFHHNLYS